MSTTLAPTVGTATDELAGLSNFERGVLLGMVFSARQTRDISEHIWERCSGRWADRCKLSYQTLLERDTKTRRVKVASLTQALISPLPNGLSFIHPSWITGLADEIGKEMVQVSLPLLPEALHSAALKYDESFAKSIFDKPIIASTRLRIASHVFAKFEPLPIDALAHAAWLTWPEPLFTDVVLRLGAFAMAGAAMRVGTTQRNQLIQGFPEPYAEWIQSSLAPTSRMESPLVFRELLAQFKAPSDVVHDDISCGPTCAQTFHAAERVTRATLLGLALQLGCHMLPRAQARFFAQRLSKKFTPATNIKRHTETVVGEFSKLVNTCRRWVEQGASSCAHES